MPKSTKQDILDTLLILLRDKTISDITVKDLTERCGISRQAFYYHFQDLYAVVDWGLRQDLELLGKEKDLEGARSVVAEQMVRNRTVVLNLYRSFERSYVEHYLRKWALPLVTEKVAQVAKCYRVTREQTDFVAELITITLLSLVLGWMDRGMPGKALEHLDDLRTISDGGVDTILERLERKNVTGE